MLDKLYLLSDFLPKICWEAVTEEISFLISFYWRFLNWGLSHGLIYNKTTQYLLHNVQLFSFSFRFCCRCLTCGLNRGLTSNKPIHYILDHGGFFLSYFVLLEMFVLWFEPLSYNSIPSRLRRVFSFIFRFFFLKIFDLWFELWPHV